jgi:hypothetical protein
MDTYWDAKIALFLENTASSVKKNGVRHKKNRKRFPLPRRTGGQNCIPAKSGTDFFTTKSCAERRYGGNKVGIEVRFISTCTSIPTFLLPLGV